MKKFLAVTALVLALGANASFAQTTEAAKPAQTAAAKTEWKEKNEFHKVIAQTFHPMEDGDFKPIRERSGELHEKALAWKNATPPAEFNTPKIANTLARLEAETKRLDDAVKKNVTDDNLAEGLTRVHDTFHEIVGLCSPGHDEHEDHNHGNDHGHDHSDPNHKH